MDPELLKKLHIGVVVRCLQGDHKPHLKEFTQVSGAVFDHAWGRTEDRNCLFTSVDTHSVAVYNTMLAVTSCKNRADPSHLKIERSTTRF